LKKELIDSVSLAPTRTVLDAIRALDDTRCGICLVVGPDRRLVGVLTDGDVRRAILQGLSLQTPVERLATRDPIVVREGMSREELLGFLNGERCARFKSILLPSVDETGVAQNIVSSVMIRNESTKWEDLSSHEPPRPVVLIGGAGFIGSVVARTLLAAGYEVDVLDRFFYGRDSLSGVDGHPGLRIHAADTRHVEECVPAIRRAWAVIHLAELVGDPLCARDVQTTFEINHLATASLVRMCAFLQVNRFLYASSCSVYGASSNPDTILTEASPLEPVSLYAKTKILAEKAIFEQQGGNFSPCVLRLGTVFGVSYRPRFDLVVNTLSMKAALEGRIEVFGGDQWRPHIHVRDVAQALLRALEAPLEAVRNRVFNLVGENLKINDVGRLVADIVPGTDLSFPDRVVDRRNYRVSGRGAEEELGFRPTVSVRDGITEVVGAIQSGDIQNPTDHRYYNILAFPEDATGV